MYKKSHKHVYSWACFKLTSLLHCNTIFVTAFIKNFHQSIYSRLFKNVPTKHIFSVAIRFSDTMPIQCKCFCLIWSQTLLNHWELKWASKHENSKSSRWKLSVQLSPRERSHPNQIRYSFSQSFVVASQIRVFTPQFHHHKWYIKHNK